MSKNIFTKFVINPCIKIKVKRKNNSFTKIGKKCNAVIINHDDELKAKIITSPVEDSVQQEFLVLPLTPDSFNLKGKTYVFAKNKDEYGHYICIIRERINSIINPGLDTQYDALKEGLLISGHIVEKDNKRYFSYENIVAFTENGARITNLNQFI